MLTVFFHRFVRTPAEVQRQALQWLQKLCLLNIPVPLSILFDMFSNGIETLQNNTQDIDEADEIEPDTTPTATTSSKKKPAKKLPSPPTLIVEVRSGCLDPDDIYTFHRGESSDAGQ